MVYVFSTTGGGSSPITVRDLRVFTTFDTLGVHLRNKIALWDSWRLRHPSVWNVEKERKLMNEACTVLQDTEPADGYGSSSVLQTWSLNTGLKYQIKAWEVEEDDDQVPRLLSLGEKLAALRQGIELTGGVNRFLDDICSAAS